MKFSKFFWFHLIILLVLVLINIPQLFNLSLFNGFYYGDSEVMAFIAYVLGKNFRLYQDFSIVYGPGRFIVLNLINKLFGTDISLPLFFSYCILVSRILVTWAIYWVTYKVLKIDNKIIRIGYSLVSLIIYLLFLRSGQDSHLIILFFLGVYAWYQQSSNKFLAIVSGLILGLIGFFRIESGIFSLISVIMVDFFSQKKDKNKKYFWISYFIFQFIYLFLIIIYGSFPNFFHDIVTLGILSQPKIMKILIQPVDFPLFEFFILANVFGVIIAQKSNNKSFMLLSSISLLSYANSLGRADFSHLYYGIVLLIPVIVLSIFYLINSWKTIRIGNISIKKLFGIIFILGLEFLILKKQITYLLVILLMTLLGFKKFFKIDTSLLLIVILFVSLYTVIKSPSLFIFYLKKQYELPKMSNVKNVKKNYLDYYSRLKTGNYGGYKLSEKDSKALVEIKNDMKDKEVFIYPSHVSLYQAIGKNPPIRYLYFNNEYTERMEQETVDMLVNKKIEYVLVSTELTKEDAIVPNQTKFIYKYIYKNYKKLKEYDFGNDNFVLMTKT